MTKAGHQKAIKKTISIASVVLGLALIVFAFPSDLGGKATWVAVSGDSMEPNLETGDVLYLWNGGNWEVGDIVVYYMEEDGKSGNIAHRLIAGNKEDGWTAMGDNREQPDPWLIPDANIKGKMVFYIPAIGAVAGAAQNQAFLAVIIGALVTVSIMLAPVGKKKRKLETSDHMKERVAAQHKIWGNNTEKLDIMETLKEGWDGVGSKQPDKKAVSAARAVISSLPNANLTVYPWAGGVGVARLWGSGVSSEGRRAELLPKEKMNLVKDKDAATPEGAAHHIPLDAGFASRWLEENTRKGSAP